MDELIPTKILNDIEEVVAAYGVGAEVRMNVEYSQTRNIYVINVNWFEDKEVNANE